MQWAGVGMWMVLGLSACSPTKTEIGNLNVIPQPQEVSQDIQAHPFVINPQTGIVYPEGNEKLQRTAEFLASYIKEATGITVRTTTEAARKNSIILAVDGSITNKEGYQLEVTSENIHLNGGSESGVFYGILAGTNGEYNKINAAHVFGGADMQIKTVENVLHIPINHYFSIDMDAMKDLGDAVGGVTVDNAFAFDAEGIHYPKGKQHLGGWEALQYARMRYEDPEGDYGRQRRQREVLIELTNKLLSFNSLLKYQEILDVIGEHGETDLSFDQMMAMLKKYTPALKTIETDQLKGYDYTGDGVTGIEGISYQLVEESERQRVENAIKEQMNLSTKDTEQSQ